MTKPQLNALRAQIDQVDAEILALMHKRMAIVAEVAKAKREEGASLRTHLEPGEIPGPVAKAPEPASVS